MKKTLSLLGLIAAVVLSTLPLSAQAQQKRVSPHDTISTVVNGCRVTIVYGRPYTKKPGTEVARKIWGGLVPYGKVWRTGADEATLFVTQKPLKFGGQTLPAGAYSLFTQPEEDGSAKLIFSKDVGQWGEEYNDQDDVLRVPMQKTTVATPVNEFTMAISRLPGDGVIRMSWENTEYSVAFTPVP